MARRARTRIIRVLIAQALLWCVLGIAALSAKSFAPIDNCRYFIETGHYVCQAFLSFYDAFDGDVVFGQPLSEAFVDDGRGLLVQYFERARMESQAQEDRPSHVQLGALVTELGYAFPGLEPADVPRFRTAVRRYYPQSRHTVSYAFLDFYLEHGGPDTFGYPLSEAISEDGYTVQYFEHAKMEWHPETEPRPEIRIGKLAELNLSRFGVPESASEPLPPPPSALSAEGELVRSSVRDLRVSASVSSVVTGQAGEQAVHVYVIDQQGRPVKDVIVAVAVRYLEAPVSYNLPPTDDSGHTEHEFELGASSPGRRVVVDVYSTYGGLVEETQTFFMPWW